MVLRSILSMPVNVPCFLEKAHQRRADGLMLDLEDSIPDSEKDRACRRDWAEGRPAARPGCAAAGHPSLL